VKQPQELAPMCPTDAQRLALPQLDIVPATETGTNFCHCVDIDGRASMDSDELFRVQSLFQAGECVSHQKAVLRCVHPGVIVRGLDPVDVTEVQGH
jgi:hypothetical protein